MTSIPNPSMDRRALLRNGGLVLSFGAIVAACGNDRAGSDDPGRLGVAAPPARPCPRPRSTTACCCAPPSRSSTRRSPCTTAAAGLDVLSADERSPRRPFRRRSPAARRRSRRSRRPTPVPSRSSARTRSSMDRAVGPILGALDGSRRPAPRRAQHRVRIRAARRLVVPGTRRVAGGSRRSAPRRC